MAVLAYIVRDGMVPGGGTRPDEDLREACVREVKEETGLDVEVLEEIGKGRSTPIFSCKIIAGEPTPKLPETTGIAWVPLDQFIKVPSFIREFLERQVK